MVFSDNRTGYLLRQCGIIACLIGLGAIATFQSYANTQKIGEPPQGTHGAATMAYQEEALDDLLKGDALDKTPKGFDPMILEAFIPDDNKTTKERVALGRKLYFDKRLSKDGTVSCATCHDVTRGFSDQRKTSEGIKDQLGRRNAPTVLNVALLQTLFWDGRSPTLEHQARLPIVNEIEMGMPNGEAAVTALKDDKAYQEAFQKAYGRDINYDDMGRAMAAFQRTLVFVDSPFRRFLAGQKEAISKEAREGWALFNGKGRCMTCHPFNTSNPLGTDNRFHNVGVSARHQNFEQLAEEALKALNDDPSEAKLEQLTLNTDMSELGRFMVTKNRADIGAFRTPLLLNIGITGPYMHDGSLETLFDVIDHYNKGGEANLFLDGGMEALALTEEEINQLVTLLFSMTDERFREANQQQLDKQKGTASLKRPFKDDGLAQRQKIAFEDRVSTQSGDTK